ncbi:cupin domain-containing protein [Blastococcus sp. TF02-09]|uniref:cupin domain-containing protein n=1 Tax=Blastococcus sp. TF02-09 TaxID=2250576 RepID=UPI001313E2F5|nr:cupin domain-containing protein [Blastococcus sp. TF02-9]
MDAVFGGPKRTTSAPQVVRGNVGGDRTTPPPQDAPMDTDVLDDGNLRLEFTITGEDSQGRLHEMRATYRPGSTLPIAHLHPNQTEHFTVEKGQMWCRVDGVETVLRAGDTLDVPAGSVHQMRNPGVEDAVVTWQTRPALRTGEFHRRLADARRTGDIAAVLEVVAEYADVFVVARQEP